MVVVLPVPLTPTTRMIAGEPGPVRCGAQFGSRSTSSAASSDRTAATGPPLSLRLRARSTTSSASAAPTSPAMSVSSTSSQVCSSGSPRPRIPLRRAMKPPRLRSMPAASGAPADDAALAGTPSASASISAPAGGSGRARSGSASSTCGPAGSRSAPSGPAPEGSRAASSASSCASISASVTGPSSTGRSGWVGGRALAPSVDARHAVRDRRRLIEAEADHPAHGVVPDRDPEEGVGCLDRAPIVRDDHELRRRGKLTQGLDEPADVRLVERGIHLVEDAERDGPHFEHREEERDGGQGALAPGEHRERLRLLAGRTGDDLHAGRRQVGRVGQAEAGEPAAEELLEAPVERRLEGKERRPELRRDQGVQLRDQRPGSIDRAVEVPALAVELVEARPDRRVLLEGERVRRTHLVEASPEPREATGRRALGGRSSRGAPA